MSGAEPLPLPGNIGWHEVLFLLEPIWEFMHLNQQLAPADALVAMGSNDISTAHYTAELFHRHMAPIIVVSGGTAHANDLLATGWGCTEAEMFARAIHVLGVPEDVVIVEAEASHTGENFVFVRRILEKRHISMHSAIVVHKPYMERRAYATGRVIWPDVDFTVTSVPCSLRQYLMFNQRPVNSINVMLGDLQRLEVYGKQGKSLPQEVPAIVSENFERLKALGFHHHLLRRIIS